MKDYSLQIVYDRQYNNLKARETFRGVKFLTRARKIVAKRNDIRYARWQGSTMFNDDPPIIIK